MKEGIHLCIRLLKGCRGEEGRGEEGRGGEGEGGHPSLLLSPESAGERRGGLSVGPPPLIPHTLRCRIRTSVPPPPPLPLLPSPPHTLSYRTPASAAF